MRSSRSTRFICFLAGLALLATRPAVADVTVIGRYTFVNGESSTRPSYFTARRIRVSTPDGREVIFDSKDGRATLIDHRRKVYWDGPVAHADSIVDVTDGSRWNLALANDTGRLKAEWDQAMSFPPDSIRSGEVSRTRQIAGYPCAGWTERSDSYVTLERWTASSLAAESKGDSTEDAVVSAIVDPVARAVLSTFWESHEIAGLCLAASMTIRTPAEQGSFRWEAVKVVDGSVPASAWAVPRGYQRARIASEIPRGVKSVGEPSTYAP